MENDNRNQAPQEFIHFDNLGYGLVEITIKKLTKESFHKKFALSVDFRNLQNKLSDGYKIYGLSKIGFFKNGPIEALFFLRIADNSYTCESISFADTLDQNTCSTLTGYISLEVARLALYANCHDNYFLGEPLPEMEKIVGHPNWIVGILFFVIYFFCFQGPTGKSIFSAFFIAVLAFLMACLFRSVKYRFKNSGNV